MGCDPGIERSREQPSGGMDAERSRTGFCPLLPGKGESVRCRGSRFPLPRFKSGAIRGETHMAGWCKGFIANFVSQASLGGWDPARRARSSAVAEEVRTGRKDQFDKRRLVNKGRF